MTDDFLRIQVKQLKVFQGISYKEISEYLEVNKNTFYNWLSGAFSFSDYKKNRLYEIISDLTGV